MNERPPLVTAQGGPVDRREEEKRYQWGVEVGGCFVRTDQVHAIVSRRQSLDAEHCDLVMSSGERIAIAMSARETRAIIREAVIEMNRRLRGEEPFR